MVDGARHPGLETRRSHPSDAGYTGLLLEHRPSHAPCHLDTAPHRRRAASLAAPMSSISALWERAEARQPDRPAVVGAERVTYRQLGARIRLLADCLAARGLAPGATCALVAGNTIEFVAGYFAILHRGGVVLPIEPAAGDQQIRGQLEDSGATLVLAHPELVERATELSSQSDAVVIAMERECGLGDPWTAPAIREGSQIAELLYPTRAAEPLGVLRSHNAVRAAAGNAIAGLGYRAGEVIAITGSLSDAATLSSQLIPILHLGGTAVLIDELDATALVSSIRIDGITAIATTPERLERLVKAPDFAAELVPTLRLVVNTGEPLDPGAYTELKSRCPAVEVISVYGHPENAICAVLPDQLAESNSASVGRAITGVEMRVADQSGNPVADDTEGELQVRGPHLFAGYHGRPDATARAFTADGWFRTGDLGWRDAAGLYYLGSPVIDLLTDSLPVESAVPTAQGRSSD